MEKQMAVARQLDDLGRIVIPGSIREALGWGTGTRLEVAISDTPTKSIAVREVSARCSLCRKESENLAKVEKGHICQECFAKIKIEP